MIYVHTDRQTDYKTLKNLCDLSFDTVLLLIILVES